MKVFRAAVIMALLAGPVYGQEQQHVPQYREDDKAKSQVEIQAGKDAEKAYRHSLSSIPDAGPTDPWGSARTVGAPKDTAKDAAKPAAKTAAKAAPTKPKTGSTPN